MSDCGRLAQSSARGWVYLPDPLFPSQQLRISRSMVAKYEGGVHSPTVSVLVRLAGLFGVTLDSLLGRDDREQLEWLAGAAPSSEEQHSARRDLERLVRELPPRQWRLLRLSFGLGLDVHELAHLLGGAKPESARRARRRAITRLRELMQRSAEGRQAKTCGECPVFRTSDN
ncbi:MAG TPA: helix-turn-helix domain-containing protein [Thermoanaerobaculia bacterium]|nr:helix-turn-helix domain-containing protein [Thermoanaerobaculia bacterium]